MLFLYYLSTIIVITIIINLLFFLLSVLIKIFVYDLVIFWSTFIKKKILFSFNLFLFCFTLSIFLVLKLILFHIVAKANIFQFSFKSIVYYLFYFISAWFQLPKETLKVLVNNNINIINLFNINTNIN